MLWEFINIFLFTLTLHVLSDIITTSYDLAIIYNMPVITRSQSKRASGTEVLLTNSSTNLPDSLISESNSTSPTTLPYRKPTILPVSSLSTNFEPREPPDLFSHDRIDQERSSSWHQPVSNSLTDVLNFEISNCLQCQTAELASISKVLGWCFLSSLSQYSNFKSLQDGG